MDGFKSKIDSFRGEYSFLSNFHPAKTVYEGIEYPTAEHAFQAGKALDIKVRRVIAGLKSPAEAKRTGRLVDIRPDWESIKITVMRDVIKAKFSNKALMEKLLKTGNAELIEGNNWKDYFWGVCNRKGENWLGKILMEIRDSREI